MLVVDLRHWLLPSGDLAPGATDGPHVTRIVEIASIALGPGITNMPCRRRRCAGRIGVRVREDVIEWSCSDCADGGAISHWRGSRWDLTEVDVGPDDDELVAYVPLAELRALRDLDLSPTIRAVLAGAPVVGEHTAVTLTEDEVTELLTALGPARRRLLAQARGRFDQVLAERQVPRRARAH